MAAAQDRQGRRCRSQYLNALAMGRRARQQARRTIDGLEIGASQDHGGQPAEWRHAGAAAILGLARQEAVAVAGYQRLHDGMAGLEGLQQDAARAAGATSPPET